MTEATTPSVQILELANDQWQVGIAPQVGAAVTHGRVQHQGRWHDFLRPTPKAALAPRHVDVGETSSYVLLPWSNRIRDGKLVWAEQTYALRINMADGTAIHGAARDFPWTVEHADETQVDLSFRSRDFVGVDFPWAFSSALSYVLNGPELVVTTSLRNDDEVSFPAGFGHHPHFQRTLTGPTDHARLQVPCSLMYPLDNCLPTGAPVPVEPRVDFRSLRLLGDAFVDDCLTGRDLDGAWRITYDSGFSVAYTADESYGHVVVYIPVGKPFFAVEPVTNANDGFNLLADGLEGSGVFVLEPGQAGAATFRLAVTSAGG